MSLIVQDLTKRYGDKVVVDHLSFRMDQPGVMSGVLPSAISWASHSSILRAVYSGDLVKRASTP